MKQFNSMIEMASFIRNNQRFSGAGRASEKENHGYNWDAGYSFERALAAAEKGGIWEEGAKLLMDAHVDMSNMKAEGKVFALDLEVTGYVPDIDAFVAGDPCNMINEGEEDLSPAPILRMGVHIGRYHGAKAGDIINRGAAIMSVVDDLEQQGYRVELTALWRNGDPDDEGAADIRLLVKEAHEHWSPQSAAFALAHPAFSRRLCFAVAERDETTGTLTRTGYGAEWHGAKDDFDIYFPRHGGWKTRETALANVLKEVEKQLTEKEAA